MAVKLTDTAAREIKSIIKQQDLDPDKICLRLGVKGGGCSGFSYILDLTESQRDTDEQWEQTFTLPVKQTEANKAVAVGDDNAIAVADDNNQEGTETFSIKIICDPKSYLYINGTELDFKDEIMGRGFVFNNPNATTTCGCGSSFAM